MSDKEQPQTDETNKTDPEIEAEWEEILEAWDNSRDKPISVVELEEIQRRYGTLSEEILSRRFNI